MKESCKRATRMSTTKLTPIMEKLERMLVQWIEHENQHAILLSTLIIQAKAESFV
jgi:hypothetical protein